MHLKKAADSENTLL